MPYFDGMASTYKKKVSEYFEDEFMGVFLKSVWSIVTSLHLLE